MYSRRGATMPLELASYISELDNTWPLSGDPTNRGDDHLRLIKNVLKLQFPGISGVGFNTPIVATEAEINNLQGLNQNLNDKLTSIDSTIASLTINLSAPPGTRMVFFQSFAPSGWTQINTYTNHMLRVVGTAGGGSGGSDSPISHNFSHTHNTSDHTLTIAEIPPHRHQYSSPGGGNSSNDLGGSNRNDNAQTGSTGGGQPHNHGPTSSANISFAPRYIDMILCTRQ